MTERSRISGEQLRHVSYEHWIRFVGTALLACLLLGISILLYTLAGIAAHHSMWLSHAAFVAGMMLFAFTLHWLFIVLLGDAIDCILITNKRLIRLQYRPLFHEDILEISFEKMKTVDARKTGILQNVLRYGTLYFESKLASVPYVSHPNNVAHVIQEAMNAKD